LFCYANMQGRDGGEVWGEDWDNYLERQVIVYKEMRGWESALGKELWKEILLWFGCLRLLQNSCWNLASNSAALRGGAFRRKLSQEVRSIRNGISDCTKGQEGLGSLTLLRSSPSLPLAFCHRKAQSWGCHLEKKGAVTHRHWSCWHLAFGFPTHLPELWENKFLLFINYPVCGILL
jgi:hypothetical protein